MNFALMFALALGIDYALFIVMRFRGALFGQRPRPGRGGRRDDGHRRQGGPLLRPDRADLALGGDARAEPRLPLDGARDHVAVLFVLAATLTLLPAVLAKLGPADRQARAALGPQRRAPLAAVRPLGRAALAPAGRSSAASPWSRCSRWRSRALACRPAMPSIKVVPTGDHSRVGYEQISAAFGPGAPGTLQVVAAARRQPRRPWPALRADPGIAAVAAAAAGRAAARS